MDQSLKLARALAVPLDYLADDEMDDLPKPDQLSEVERTAVKIVRANRIDEEEVIRRLTFDPGMPQPMQPWVENRKTP